MQYMLLIYGDMDAGASLPEAEQAAQMRSWFEYTDWLAGQGWMRGGDALMPTDQATSVRMRDGERLVVDGPFAETKEQLGGYYLLEVDHLDDAIEAAARCPGAETGTIELRPVADVGEAPGE